MGCKSAGPMGAHVADNLARVADGKDEEAFDWALPFYCVSLGRRDGLIQFALADGSPTGRVLRGRAAALFKELICRATVLAMHLDRLGLVRTRWKKSGRASRLAAASPRRLSA